MNNMNIISNKKILSTLFLVIILQFLCLLTGCNSYDNVSKTLFVNTIAIDFDNDTNEYLIYYHMTNPSSLTTASLGGGGNNTSPFSIAKGKGKTIFEAMELISTNSNKKIKLTHIQAIIFTMNYLSYNNLLQFHEFIKTNPNLYSDFGILVTDSKIEDIFRIADIEDASPYYSIIVSSNDANKSHKITSFIELSRGITENYINISFPFVRTFEDVWETQKEKIHSLSIIGDVYINKKNSIIIVEEKDFPILNLINTDGNTDLSINNVSYFITKHKTKIIHTNKNNFKIKIYVEAYVTKYCYIDDSDAKNLFIKEMEDSLTKMIDMMKEKNIDLFSVNNIMYRKNKLKSTQFYKDAQYTYNFDINLISSL